jgi:hypothetical protein
MAALWQENFDFYEGAAKTGRAFVTIDLAAAAHAPVASHPVRLQFRVKMLEPRADGLRSNEEAEALFALEDKLADALHTGHDAIYVARLVAFGFSEFFFYVSTAQRSAAAAIAPLVKSLAPYELEWFDEDDATWERYFELYPNAYAMQTILNRNLIAHMVEAKDRLEIPRVIDHLAYFPSREQAEAAAKALVAADFTTDPVQPPKEEGGGWGLQFHREDQCDGESADEFTFEVLDLIIPHEGDYDGWGSPVQAPPIATA